MKLPNADSVFIPAEKILNYLLSSTHRDGRHKAAVFFRFGFRRSAWQELAQALINHARQYDIVKEENTSFGVRYVIEGDVDAPDGRMLLLRSVWFVEKGQSIPHFVTAYRLKGARRA